MPGDLFRFKTRLLPGLFIFSRVIVFPVISSDGFLAGSTLVFTYDASSPNPEPDYTLLRPTNLLVRPSFVNRLGWTRGYWETFGNIPISDSDQLKSLWFRDTRGSFVNLDGKLVSEHELPKNAILSVLALGNFNVLESIVVSAIQKRAQNGA